MQKAGLSQLILVGKPVGKGYHIRGEGGKATEVSHLLHWEIRDMDSAGVEEGVVVLILDIVENLPENVFLSFKLPGWSRERSREWRTSETGERGPRPEYRPQGGRPEWLLRRRAWLCSEVREEEKSKTDE
jgi:hypothetical protein